MEVGAVEARPRPGVAGRASAHRLPVVVDELRRELVVAIDVGGLAELVGRVLAGASAHRRARLGAVAEIAPALIVRHREAHPVVVAGVVVRGRPVVVAARLLLLRERARHLVSRALRAPLVLAAHFEDAALGGADHLRRAARAARQGWHGAADDGAIRIAAEEAQHHRRAPAQGEAGAGLGREQRRRVGAAALGDAAEIEGHHHAVAAFRVGGARLARARGVHSRGEHAVDARTGRDKRGAEGERHGASLELAPIARAVARVTNLGDQVVTVEVGAKVPSQRQPLPRREGVASGGAVSCGASAEPFGAERGELGAALRGAKTSAVQHVDTEALGVHVGQRREGQLRLIRIVVLEQDAAGHERPVTAELFQRHRLGFARPLQRGVHHVGVGRVVVSEHEPLPARVALTTVGDPFLFEQARQEGERGLGVLHHASALVIPLGEPSIERDLGGRAAQHHRHDLRHGEVLVHPREPPERQELQPRDERQLVEEAVVTAPALNHLRDHAAHDTSPEGE